MPRRPGGEAEIQARIAAAPGLGTADAHRLAGLLDGECSLGLTANNRDDWRCACQVSLREDDRDTLVGFRHKLGIGHLWEVPARAGSHPQVRWKVESKAECLHLADVLDAHPFRGRKLLEYEIWR